MIENENDNIVKQYMLENTTIKICDDYCANKTADEIAAILDQCAAIASRYIIDLEQEEDYS